MAFAARCLVPGLLLACGVRGFAPWGGTVDTNTYSQHVAGTENPKIHCYCVLNANRACDSFRDGAWQCADPTAINELVLDDSNKPGTFGMKGANGVVRPNLKNYVCSGCQVSHTGAGGHAAPRATRSYATRSSALPHPRRLAPRATCGHTGRRATPQSGAS